MSRHLKSAGSSPPKNPQSLFLAVAAIIVFAIAFGGGGSKYGLANLVVQLGALLALSFHRRAFIDFWRSAPFALRLLTALSILLPAAFLIPLPQSVWSSLPGRELVVQSLDLVGANDWATASVDPIRTLLALSALIAPLALLSIGWSTPRDRLIWAGWIVVALGLINVLIGIPQVLSNGQSALLYPENPMPGVLFGTFANRNSTGLFLVGCLALAALLPPPPRIGRTAFLARVAICALIVVAVILTRSRTALVLAVIPLALAGLRFVLAARRGKAPNRPSLGRRGWLSAIPIVLVVAVLGALVASSPGRLSDSLDRFGGEREDARVYIWEDGAYAAERYWPLGSGTGTFDEVFQIDESLENMSVRKAGRAHNDYLEVAIESGIPGLALVAGWLLLLLWLSWRARNSHDRWIAWSGAVILLVIALQSITDYPLRNLTMLTFASFGLLILARFGAPPEGAPEQEIIP